MKINFVGVKLEKRGDTKRHVFHCESKFPYFIDPNEITVYLFTCLTASTENNNQRILIGDLVVIEVPKGNFFAYVTFSKCKCKHSIDFTYVHLNI